MKHEKEKTIQKYLAEYSYSNSINDHFCHIPVVFYPVFRRKQGIPGVKCCGNLCTGSYHLETHSCMDTLDRTGSV